MSGFWSVLLILWFPPALTALCAILADRAQGLVMPWRIVLEDTAWALAWPLWLARGIWRGVK